MITVKMLEELGACDEQRERFVEVFGSLADTGVEITEELCLGHYNDFDFGWCAEHLAPHFNDSFLEVTEDAWQEYNRHLGELEFVPYSYKFNNEVLKKKREAYEEGRRELRFSYYRANALAFWDAYQKEQKLEVDK